MRIIGLDPGKKNFAFSCIEDGHVIYYGMLKNVLTELDETLPSQIPLLQAELADILAKFPLNPATDYICSERFMKRPGQGKGAVSEFINITLGLFMAWVAPVKLFVFSSSPWKRHYTKCYPQATSGQVSDYLLTTLDPGGVRGMEIHEADAIGIGLYHFEKATKKQLLLGCMSTDTLGTNVKKAAKKPLLRGRRSKTLVTAKRKAKIST